MQTRNFLPLAVGICLLFAANSAAPGAMISNAIYEAEIADTTDGFSVGSWTAFTGTAHPAGPGKELLYFGPTTSFSSLRVYSSGTDYTFGGQGLGSVDMDPFVTSEGASPLAVDGHRTVWDITAESLTVVQDVLLVPPSAGATVEVDPKNWTAQ